MIHVGIDPGVGGAVAIYQRDITSGVTLLAVHDLPVVEKILKDGRKRKRIDVGALHGLLAAFPVIDSITIEDVHSMPGEGEVNAFSFGHCLGTLDAVSRLCCSDVRYVTPQAWKGAFGLTAEKGESRYLAQSLTGDCQSFRRVMDTDRAEAALIGLYGASGGIVEHQGAALDAYRAEARAKPRKARRGEAPTVSGDEILERLRARCAPAP